MSDFEKLFETTLQLKRNKETLEDVIKTCECLRRDYSDELNNASSQNSFNDLFNGINFDTADVKPENSKVILRNPSENEIKLLEDKCNHLPLEESQSIKLALNLCSDNGNREVDQRLNIAAVGQINAGKSTLINIIMKQKIALQSQTRLTSRITCFTYSKPKFVAEMHNSELTRLSINENMTKKDFNLSQADRKSDVELRVGQGNRFLLHGFNFLDTPGLNDVVIRNKVCRKMTESLLPLVIYVIDGRMGLVESDLNDIQNMKLNFPELIIVYFVTKLDMSDRGNDCEDDITVAKRRLRNAFVLLQKHNLIDVKEEMLNCRIFHGANLWTIESIQKDEADDTEITKFNRERYIHFQQSLTLIIKDSMEALFKKETLKVQTTLENLIEKSRICACDIADEVKKERNEKIKIIDEYRSTEGQLYDKEIDLMATELKDKIRATIDEEQQKSDRSIIDDVLRDYDSSKEGDLTDEKLNQWRKKLQELIDNKLVIDIKQMTVCFMADKEVDLRGKLKEIAKCLVKGRYNYPSFNAMLKNRLFYEYQVPDDSSENIAVTTLDSKKLSRIFLNIGNLFRACLAAPIEDRPKNSRESMKSWLENQYKDLLTHLNKEETLDKLTELIYHEFKVRHESFTNKLNELTDYMKKDRIVGRKERQTLQNISNNFAIQFVRLLDVTTSFKIPPIHEDDRQFLSAGSQASVYKCKILPSLLRGNETGFVVEKHYANNNFSMDSLNGDLAMEIFYSSRLNGPNSEDINFLTMLGLRLNPTTPPGQLTLSVFFEYLELGDCKKFLSKNVGKVSTSQRLKLALDVSKGLAHLHELKITHRDIKLENILIRCVGKNEYKAVIADYGFSKSIGFLNNTKNIGSILYMAPELYGNQTGDFLNEKIDVYSFGILFWLLLCYCYDMNNIKEYPEFVTKSNLQNKPDAFQQAVMNENLRPEHKSHIDKIVFDLMQDCWKREPNERPSFRNGKGVVYRLESICNCST